MVSGIGKPRAVEEVLLVACLIVVVAWQAVFMIWTAASYLLR
jgi:hypothetical protein